jgi:hypothetical protein
MKIVLENKEKIQYHEQNFKTYEQFIKTQE